MKSLNKFCNPNPNPTNKAADPATNTDKLNPNSCKPVRMINITK
jgi:hypothetical protein